MRLLSIELFEWVVHFQDVDPDKLELRTAEVMPRCRLLRLSLLSQHLLLDFGD